MKPVGYLFYTEQSALAGGYEGEPGAYYDYILAKQGVYVHAQKDALRVLVHVGLADIRGLADLHAPFIGLTNGKIPINAFDLVFDSFKQTPWKEDWGYIDSSYHVGFDGSQEAAAGSVKYARPDDVLVDMHSHGKMNAFFSTTDDHDDQGLKIAIVVGKLDSELPVVRIRACAYGYFADFLPLDMIFEGRPAHSVNILRSIVVKDEESQEEVAMADIGGFRVPLLDKFFSRRDARGL